MPVSQALVYLSTLLAATFRWMSMGLTPGVLIRLDFGDTPLALIALAGLSPDKPMFVRLVLISTAANRWDGALQIVQQTIGACVRPWRPWSQPRLLGPQGSWGQSTGLTASSAACGMRDPRRHAKALL